MTQNKKSRISDGIPRKPSEAMFYGVRFASSRRLHYSRLSLLHDSNTWPRARLLWEYTLPWKIPLSYALSNFAV